MKTHQSYRVNKYELLMKKNQRGLPEPRLEVGPLQSVSRQLTAVIFIHLEMMGEVRGELRNILRLFHGKNLGIKVCSAGERLLRKVGEKGREAVPRPFSAKLDCRH